MVFNGEIGIYREPVEASPPAEFCIKNLDFFVYIRKKHYFCRSYDFSSLYTLTN